MPIYYSFHIKLSCGTCLTNHMELISHRIMPVVINGLRDGRTQTYMLTIFMDKNNFKKPVTHLPVTEAPSLTISVRAN